MVFPRARLVVSACLFVGWLAFLLYLVLQNQHVIVLSRPQLLAAPICIIAKVGTDKDGKPEASVMVQRVVWCMLTDLKAPAGKIEVKNLPLVGARQGFDGPGTYILPLQPAEPNDGHTFILAPVPHPVRDDRIYPLTPVTESQLEEIERLRG